MILETIHDPIETKKYQEIFRDKIYKDLTNITINTVGFQGGSRKEEIHYSNDKKLWYVFSTDLENRNRYWNAFGVSSPLNETNLSIELEINIPFELNRRVAGVFLKDKSTNTVYLGHRGLLGGSTKGITKDLFFETYEKEFGKKIISVQDGNTFSKMAVISALESPDFVDKVSQLLHMTYKMKSEFRKKTAPQKM